MIPGNTSSQGKYADPPTSVSASAGDAQATVSFTLPVYDGKGVATYVATSSPSGITASGASSPITVTGLANGTSYTFTVTTISGYGVSATSVASNAVSPVLPDPCAGSPAAGTVLSSNYCSGTTLVRNVSDGCNGVTVQTVESNSATCGYVPPPSPTCGCTAGSQGQITFCTAPFTIRASTGYYTQCNFSPEGCACPACGEWVELSGFDYYEPLCNYGF